MRSPESSIHFYKKFKTFQEQVYNLLNDLVHRGLMDFQAELLIKKELLAFQLKIVSFVSKEKGRKHAKPEKEVMTKTEQRVLEIIKGTAANVRNSDIRKHGTDLSPRSVHRALVKLVNEGLLERSEDGKSVFYRLVPK